MKFIKSSRFMLITSMTIFGTIGLFVRNIPLRSAEIALYRSILAVLLVSVFLIFNRSRQKPSPAALKRALPLLFISGSAIGFNWILLFEAYNYTTVSNATLAYYFAPVIVTVACPILFKEKMKLKHWLCFGASTLGVVLITGFGGVSGDGTHLFGVLLGLCAALLYASVVLINKFIKDVDGITRTLLQFICAAVVLLPYVAFSGGFNLELLDVNSTVCLLTLGLVHTGIAYCLYFSSLKSLRGQEVAVMSYIDPLVAVIISIAVLREPFSVWEIIGGVLILGAALANEIQLKKSKDKNT